MTLRLRTLRVIGATVAGLLAVLYAVSSVLWLRSLAGAEAENAAQALRGCLSVYRQTVDEFGARFADWSAWDDTYAFIENANKDYIRSNLVDASLANLRLDLMIFVHSSGRIVWGAGFDQEKKKKTAIPGLLRRRLVPGDPLLRSPRQGKILSGILLLPEGPIYVVARPIITSESKGPIRGTLIVGRRLNTAEIERLTTITRLPLSLARFDDARLPPDFRGARSVLGPGAPFFIRPLSADTIAGYALLKDVYGKPALLLRVAMPREIYKQGLVSLRYLIGSLLLVGLVFAAVTLLLLERLVLSRLARLCREVLAVGKRGDLALRLHLPGSDELSHVGEAINEMLEALQSLERARERAALQLRAAKEEAEAASRAKSAFVANMSHELRTPLNAIIGYSEMLQEEAMDTGQQVLLADLQRIHTAGKHLLTLINDVLDLSRIEAGRMELFLERFDLEDLIGEVVATVEPLVQKNGNTLEVEYGAGLGSLYADQTKVRQSLLNLLGNACKFTERGTITLRAGREPVERGDWVTLSVGDTGIGMNGEMLSRLFEEFSQADASTTRRYGGTGLGLALSRHYCRMMGGEITVESRLGHGSTFTIRLPQTGVPGGASPTRERFSPVSGDAS